jgi:hypothetical protein
MLLKYTFLYSPPRKQVETAFKLVFRTFTTPNIYFPGLSTHTFKNIRVLIANDTKAFGVLWKFQLEKKVKTIWQGRNKPLSLHSVWETGSS